MHMRSGDQDLVMILLSLLNFLHVFFNFEDHVICTCTREMQGIVGQVSDLRPSECILWDVVSLIFFFFFFFFFFFDRLNWRAWCLMKKDQEKQRRPTSNVTVRYSAWTQQLTRELNLRTSSDRTFLWGTHVRGNSRICSRVGQGLRLPMKKKMNVEEKNELERLKQLLSPLQLAPS